MSVGATRPQSVLVIDDDPISRELVCLFLEAEGFSVCAVESGAAALEHLRERRAENPPEIILADLQMPGISGVELAAALRDICGTAFLLSMSATRPAESLGSAAESLRSAYDGFLLKPFTPEQFQSAVRNACVAAKTPLPGAEPGRIPGGHSIPSPCAVQILNPSVHQKLASILQSNLRALYDLCLADTRERIGRMLFCAHAGDHEAFRREAHAIKGGCSMLGADEIANLAAGMERIEPEAWNSKDAIEGAETLMTACARLESML